MSVVLSAAGLGNKAIRINEEVERLPCVSCGIEKPSSTEYFHRSRNHERGLLNRCKDCTRRSAAENRHRNLQRRFGLSVVQYLAMFHFQGGKCAICARTDSGVSDASGTRAMAVDHCHKSGKIRALLCNPCNTVLAQADDSPTRLRRAADYLENHCR